MKNLMKNSMENFQTEISLDFLLPVISKKRGKKIDVFLASLEKDLELKLALKNVFEKVVDHALSTEFKNNSLLLIKAKKAILEAILANSEIREMALNVATQCFLHKMSQSHNVDFH